MEGQTRAALDLEEGGAVGEREVWPFGASLLPLPGGSCSGG